MAKAAQRVGEDDDQFLRDMAVPELTGWIQKAEAIRHEKVEAEKSGVTERLKAEIERLKAEAAQYEIGQSELFGVAVAARGTRGRPAAKYRSPDGQTWSGRGRLASWLEAAEKAGHKRDEYLIEKPDQEAA